MSEIIMDLTGRLFMSAEEELMETLGWDSIVNLWRVWEAIEEIEVAKRNQRGRKLKVKIKALLKKITTRLKKYENETIATIHSQGVLG